MDSTLDALAAKAYKEMRDDMIAELETGMLTVGKGGPMTRTTRLLQGKADSSARLRLVESWSMALRMARDSPVVGTGLGNFEQGLAAVRQDLPDRDLLGPETQGWNVLAHVLDKPYETTVMAARIRKLLDSPNGDSAAQPGWAAAE